jgi:hypothetical protein
MTAVNKLSDGPALSVNPPEKSEASNPAARVNPSGLPKQSDDYVAPNTIVYLNKRTAEEAAAKAKSPKRSARSRAVSSRVDDGIVAANSVTYLSNKTAPQAPKSGVGPAPNPK